MMLRRLIRKRHFRKILAQLRGAKKLRKREEPNFVINTVNDLAEVPIGLVKDDFPNILVGSHAAEAEIILRQIFLLRQEQMFTAIMQSIGCGKPVALPIPPVWVNYLIDNGVNCSKVLCKIQLYLGAFKKIFISMAKFMFLAVQINNPKYPGCPYVLFLSLQQNNLPGYDKGKKTRDIITWYKESIIRRPNINKIWAQAKVNNEYVPPNDLIISRNFLPRFSSISACINYYSIILAAFFASLIGIFRGRWWYGFILTESISVHYVNNLKREHLAKEYFFNNSTWFYKPMWTYEVENGKSLISQVFYSTNQDCIVFNDYKFTEKYFYQLMKWKRFIVWDQQQKDNLKQFCPNSEYILARYIDITGKNWEYYSANKEKILSVFDVTPTRPAYFPKMGIAIPIYYSEKLNIKFLQDIKEMFNDDKWIIIWKPKRNVGTNFISDAFKRKQLKIVNGNLIRADPGVSASSLVESSDAVISMPFSSPSIIAKFKDVPSIFYDASGCVRNKTSHGIPLLKNKDELKKWFESLAHVHTLK